MYKYPAKDINEYIFERFPEQEEFTLEHVQILVHEKKKKIKEKDVDDLYNLVHTG